MNADKDANRRWPDVAIPPGETLADELEARNMTRSDLAARMGRPPQAISEIITGNKVITPDTAQELEMVLGIPAYIWLNLERDYQLNRARLERLELKQEESAASDRPRATSSMPRPDDRPLPPGTELDLYVRRSVDDADTNSK